MYEDLIKELRYLEKVYSICGNTSTKEYKLAVEAADAIEKLSKPRWIPVTERLPEKNGSYLVYIYGEVTEMNYWHGKWRRFGDDYTKAVTHWMPLPEPPKEE